MKHKLYVLIILFSINYHSYSQVGIGTTSPDPSSILDIEASDKGILVPRLTTAARNIIINPAVGLLIFNLSTNHFEFNSGTTVTPRWSTVNTDVTVSSDAGNLISSGSDSGAYLSSTTYIGKFIVSTTGSQTISGIPFEPSHIKFTAYANIENYDINTNNGVGNNNNTYQNTFGNMNGYATNYAGIIDQQVIFNGGSGNSINNISRYASSSSVIGIRYTNQNGNNQGLTAASITSFNIDGFTLNVTNHTEDIVVLFEAYR